MPFWGTSFSAAYVSGVAALVRAKYPDLSAHQSDSPSPPDGTQSAAGSTTRSATGWWIRLPR